MNERRNFQRVPFAISTEINCAGNQYSGELSDISLQGATVLIDENIPLTEGNRCRLTIALLGSEVTLRFDTDIIQRQGKRIGFRFVSKDIETASHLRRLLELNIGSSEVIEKEIAQWLKPND